MPAPGNVTELLMAMQQGNKDAEARLLSLVYDELRRIASRYLRRERRGHTLQATDLANEAYIRLVAKPPAEWNSRSHFYAVAAQVMRRILVDYARARNAVKRGQGKRVDIDSVTLSVDSAPEELLLLDMALTKLAQLDPRRSKVVEMRVFGGLSEKEISEVLELSERTVKRDWSLARAWLFGEMGGASQKAVSEK